MSDTMNLNVRISGSLKDYVARSTKDGDYENTSEFVRDLIRNKKAADEEKAFQSLKAKLQDAADAPRSRYSGSSADEIRSRVKDRLKP